MSSRTARRSPNPAVACQVLKIMSWHRRESRCCWITTGSERSNTSICTSEYIIVRLFAQLTVSCTISLNTTNDSHTHHQSSHWSICKQMRRWVITPVMLCSPWPFCYRIHTYLNSDISCLVKHFLSHKPRPWQLGAVANFGNRAHDQILEPNVNNYIYILIHEYSSTGFE